MKYILLAAIALNLTGCALVSCNHTFPKLEWYWSQEAIDCRHMHQQEQDYIRTNSVKSNDH